MSEDYEKIEYVHCLFLAFPRCRFAEFSCEIQLVQHSMLSCWRWSIAPLNAVMFSTLSVIAKV
eukprot:5076124-Pleurochrysis_carterae.AAC.2